MKMPESTVSENKPYLFFHRVLLVPLSTFRLSRKFKYLSGLILHC